MLDVCSEGAREVLSGTEFFLFTVVKAKRYRKKEKEAAFSQRGTFVECVHM